MPCVGALLEIRRGNPRMAKPDHGWDKGRWALIEKH
jgi:hypothetical protein